MCRDYLNTVGVLLLHSFVPDEEVQILDSSSEAPLGFISYLKKITLYFLT
jgi:hypothetical protein